MHRVWNKQHQYWIHRERLVVSLCPLEPINTSMQWWQVLPTTIWSQQGRRNCGVHYMPEKTLSMHWQQGSVDDCSTFWAMHERILQEKGDFFFLYPSAVLCAHDPSSVFICFSLHSNSLTGCHSIVQVNLKLQLQMETLVNFVSVSFLIHKLRLFKTFCVKCLTISIIRPVI